MKNFKRAFSIITVIAVITAAPACKKNDFSKKENEAVVIATVWLHLIDDGKYSQGWAGASGLFKRSIPEDRWIKLLSSTRKPFGSVITRSLHSREYRTSLPGAPDGEYVVIIYKTLFQKKKESTETVTPMKDADGKWRVSGYYIK